MTPVETAGLVSLVCWGVHAFRGRRRRLHHADPRERKGLSDLVWRGRTRLAGAVASVASTIAPGPTGGLRRTSGGRGPGEQGAEEEGLSPAPSLLTSLFETFFFVFFLYCFFVVFFCLFFVVFLCFLCVFFVSVFFFFLNHEQDWVLCASDSS
jgi:hypothetical protein